MWQMLKKMLYRLFGSGKGKDEISSNLHQLLTQKDELSRKVQDMSDRKDRLNERFKLLIAEKNDSEISDLKASFQSLYKDVILIRPHIHSTINALKTLKIKTNDLSIEDALDELNIAMKVLQNIVKHNKAIQGITSFAKTQMNNQAANDLKDPEKSLTDTTTASHESESPPGIIKSTTALENLQSQQTVLLQINDDMLKPPSDQSNTASSPPLDGGNSRDNRESTNKK